MNTYNAQRVGDVAVALWIAQRAFEGASDYALNRMQFWWPIAEFQGLQWMLVDVSISLKASRALLHDAADGVDDGFSEISAAAQAKVLASETALKVTQGALQFMVQWAIHATCQWNV